MIETELKELFPDTEVIRLDTDTVTAAGSHEALFERFRNEKDPYHGRDPDGDQGAEFRERHPSRCDKR